MSQVSDLNAQLLLCQRERDACREENLRYRDKLLEIAKCCATCHGTGMVEDVVHHAEYGPQVQTIDCESCLDIRELLA